MGVLYEDTQLDSQLKHDLPLSNPERPHLSVIELSIFTEEAFGEIIILIFPNDKYYYNILTVNFNPPRDACFPGITKEIYLPNRSSLNAR